MATTPLAPVTPAVGFFNPADGSDPNVGFDPTNTAIIHSMIELGAVTKEGQTNLLTALRAAFGSLAAASASRQRLADEIEELEAQLEAKTVILEEQLEPALQQAIQARDAAQAALDAELAKGEDADPELVAQLRANLAAAQNNVSQANAAVQQARSEINQITNDVATKQAELADAEQLSLDLEAQIADLKAQLAKARAEQPLADVSNSQIIDSAHSQQKTSDVRTQNVNEARFDEQLTDLNYETLTRVIETLVQEVIAERGIEDLGAINLSDARVRQALTDAGVDLAAYGLDGPGPLPAGLFQPIIDSVQLLVVYGEIDQLVAQRAALQATLPADQTQPLPQAVPVLPGSQQPVPTEQLAQQPVVVPVRPPVTAFNTETSSAIPANNTSEDGDAFGLDSDNPVPAPVLSPLQTSITRLSAIIDAKILQVRSLEQGLGVPTQADLGAVKDVKAPTPYTSFIALTGDRSETSFNTIPDVVPLSTDRGDNLYATDTDVKPRTTAATNTDTPVRSDPEPLLAVVTQQGQTPPGNFNVDPSVSPAPRVYVGPL